MAKDFSFGSTLDRVGWTGGQYSVFRILLGAYLFAHFIQLTQWAWELFSSPEMMLYAEQSLPLAVFANIVGLDDSSGLLVALTITAVAVSLLFIAGIADKWAAFYLCFALACLYGADPLISKQSLHYLGWMLLAHLLMPKAPYGSLAARGRPDPGGGWRLPILVYCITLFIFAMSYFHSANLLISGSSWYSSVILNDVFANPLPRSYFALGILAWLPPGTMVILGFTIQFILFFVLPWRRLRPAHPVFWSVAFGLQLCFAFLLDFPDPTITMLLFHLIVFNPDWIWSRKRSEHATLFYDGKCVLCHNLVRFVLAEDTDARFTYSPLQSEYFKEAFTAEERISLPHSSIMLKSDAGLIFEADAAIRILKLLGGLWLLLALVLSAFPRRWRDAGYHFAGDRRYRIFGRTETVCPVVLLHLHARFRE